MNKILFKNKGFWVLILMLAAFSAPGWAHPPESQANTPVLSRNRLERLSVPRDDGRVWYYSQRTDILKVAPYNHSLPTLWESTVSAQILFVTQILNYYRGHEVYFLARDSEFLYDIARWILRNKPEALAKVHLINVSRLNVENLRQDPNKKSRLLAYLQQEGISATRVQSGQKFVMVDTGFTGSVINTIRSLLGANDLQMKAHLIMSLNHDIPSSYTFLAKVIENVDRESTTNLEGYLVDYENLPREFNRAKDYLLFDDGIEPLEDSRIGVDGKVNVNLARQYRESLKYYLVSGTFENERLRFERVLKRVIWLLQSSLTKKDKVSKINKLLHEVPAETVWRRRLLRDALETYIQSFRVDPGVSYIDFSLEKDWAVIYPTPSQVLSAGPLCPRAFR